MLASFYTTKGTLKTKF